jgi:2-polyprenyl-6-methoxyphenol hydroxylase-like FAD-dependent oxidoreductase
VARRSVDADVGGGGPAGAAAIARATRGLSAFICEREQAGRDRPGETVHPGIVPLLRQLGVGNRLEETIGARHAGIWIEWGGPRRFEAFGSDASGPWSGLQLWLADFDSLLLARARETGVEVRQGCAVTAPLMRNGMLDGLETAAGPTHTNGG